MNRLILPLLFLLLLATITAAQTVHITKIGKKYHNASCIFLKTDLTIDLRDAVARGYTPCSKCKPPVLNSVTQTATTTHTTTGTVDKPNWIQLQEDVKPLLKRELSASVKLSLLVFTAGNMVVS